MMQKAAKDDILLHMDDKKLQKNIIAEDLDYDNTVKYGLALEQGAKKVDEIRGVNDKKVNKQTNKQTNI